MDILILNWKDIKHPEVGGAEIIVYELAKRLVKDGHKVTWFCRGFKDGKSEEMIEGIKVVRRGTLYSTFFRAPLYYWSQKKKPDLVIDMSNTIYWQTPLWAWKSKKIAYLNQLAQEVFDYEFFPLVSFFGKMIEKLQYITYFRTPFVCYSESTKDDLGKMGIPPYNVDLFPLGIDHSRYSVGIKSKEPLFICVNRLVKMKRTDLAIKAMTHVVKDYPTAKLFIVGYGYERQSLEKLRDKLNLKNNVYFLDENILFFGKNVKDMKIKMMQEAWALIFPSVKEGWGMTVTECASCGTPTIATSVTGLKDSVIDGKTGILVSNNPTETELATAMKTIINDKDLRNEYSKNAVEYWKNFTWNESYKQFKKVIEKVNSAKNILIFSWRGPKHPHEGGAELATHEHAKQWVQKGANVFLFTSNFNGGKTYELIDGVKVIRKGTAILGVQFAGFLWYLFGKHIKFNVIVDQFHGIPFFTPLYVTEKKLAYIHETAKEVWLLNHLKFPMKYIYGGLGYVSEPLIFKLFYKNVPFMTVSDSTKSDLVEFGVPSRNINVIHNGITLPTKLTEHKKEKLKTIIYLGALAKDKGVEDVINVFSMLHQEFKNSQLWIVGRGSQEYVEHLEDLIKKKNISANVKFWGFVDNEKKYELLSRSHLFINPSIREGWGLVNIEANHVGTPVLGYNVAGIKDSVLDGKTGVLTQVGDIEELANNAIKILQDEKFYNLLRRNSIDWSEKFTWEKSTNESFDYLNTLK